MNILSIESSSRILSVALNSKGKAICRFKSKEKFKSEHIIKIIEKTLNCGKLSLGDLDYIAVDLGPGSFTGLRVGIATAKALSLAAKIKIIGISSLDCIAAGVKDNCDKDICAVIDARRNNLYCAIFRKTSSGADFSLRKKLSYSLLNPRQLLGKINSPCIFAGDGLLNFSELVKQEKPELAFFAPEDQWYPDAKVLAKLALASIRNTEFKENNILPIYLYPKECQIRNEKTT